MMFADFCIVAANEFLKLAERQNVLFRVTGSLFSGAHFETLVRPLLMVPPCGESDDKPGGCL